jgi:OmpA-OmpF porin, OOP family
MMSRASILTSLWLAANLAGAAPARADCARLVEAFDAIVRERQLPALAEAERAIFIEPACTAAQRQRARRNAALAHVRAAEGLAGAAERLALLQAGEAFAKPWQLMASIGDARRELGEHSGASLAYQLALADIADAASVPTPPPPAVTQRLLRLAGQERALARNFVRGDILLTRSMRNVVVDSTPVPVQFEYDSDRLTSLGHEYAEELWRALDLQGKPKITLIGHTDPRGGDAYNRSLSLRRAQALRQWLVGKGYPAEKVAVDGKGESDPLCIEGLAGYSPEQVWQMLRRVEVRFSGQDGPAPQAGTHSCQFPPRG